MRSRPPMLVVALAVTALVAGCEAKVYGAAAAKPAPPHAARLRRRPKRSLRRSRRPGRRPGRAARPHPAGS
ncbi:putative lipoprotein [Mycobacterium xenopi 4042]|uniref:Putative lipoprotein n=1 Tax=Mycobacterium xenopi 4042 TaxID=1299334 RepID=X8E8S1_MYCXE|nr:putative lipoprotein [Mycobacterium xenopi 4042]